MHSIGEELNYLLGEDLAAHTALSEDSLEGPEESCKEEPIQQFGFGKVAHYAFDNWMVTARSFVACCTLRHPQHQERDVRGQNTDRVRGSMPRRLK